MMGSHDRRLAKLEGALPSQPTISEEGLLIAGIILGPERTGQLRLGGYEALEADERQMMIASIDAELARRGAAEIAR
jgi:hypothetical protein